MSAHTPGPWHVDITGESIFVRGQDETAACQCGWLRGRWGLRGRKTSEEVMANARLIAAAPELLEALKHSLRMLACQTHRRLKAGHEPCHLCKLAVAAIAKAEGKE